MAILHRHMLQRWVLIVSVGNLQLQGRLMLTHVVLQTNRSRTRGRELKSTLQSSLSSEDRGRDRQARQVVALQKPQILEQLALSVARDKDQPLVPTKGPIRAEHQGSARTDLPSNSLRPVCSAFKMPTAHQRATQISLLNECQALQVRMPLQKPSLKMRILGQLWPKAWVKTMDRASIRQAV